VELKKEAKKRGLSQSTPRQGTKATLISRIQEHDQNAVGERVPRSPPQVVPGTRNASTQAATPGVPPSSQPASASSSPPMIIRLPDLSQPDPEVPVQIPFLPDFWESARPKAKSPELALPKILVVGGTAAVHSGEPTLIIQNHHELTSIDEYSPESIKSDTKSASPSRGGIWRDLADDIGLPSSLKVGALTADSRSSSEPAVSPMPSKNYSRPLDKDEVRGAWLLLGLFAGSWIAGGIVNSRKSTETAKDVKDT